MMRAKKIVVIGLGDFGRQLVRALYREGHEVTAIDRDLQTIEDIADECTNAVCLSSTDEKAMRSQGLEDMDAIILASAESFETLIVTADILKKIGVKEIIGRYRNDLQIRILRMLGVSSIYNPEETAARNMAERFHHEGIKTSIFMSESHRVAEIVVPSSITGLSLIDSRLREDFRLNLITIKRPRKKIKGNHRGETDEILGLPDANFVFEEGDILIVFGTHHDIDRFLDQHSD